MRVTDAAGRVLLPALAYTKSDEHHAFPGSLWLSWDTLMATLVDIGRSLAASGITPAAVRQRARRQLGAGAGGLPGAPAPLRAAHVLHPPGGARRPGRHAVGGVDELGMGMHGGHGETSLMLHLRPDLVRMEMAGRRVPTALTELPAHRIRQARLVRLDHDDFGPDGHIGDPTGATAEHGEAFRRPPSSTLAEAIVEATGSGSDRRSDAPSRAAEATIRQNE